VGWLDGRSPDWRREPRGTQATICSRRVSENARGQVEGKIAIVTGGASGIGAACAATLGRGGANVVVTDLDDAGGPAVVDKITSAGGKAIYLYQDVSLEKSWPGSNRGRRPALWTSGRNDRQRRYRHPVQSGRNVVGRLATANCSQPGRCVPVSQIRRSSDATRWRWLHYHYVIPLLASAGSAGRGAVAPRREACACSRRRSRWNVP
jgi:short chain dehydrogenase